MTDKDWIDYTSTGGMDLANWINRYWRDEKRTADIMHRYQNQFQNTMENLTGSGPTREAWQRYWDFLPSALGKGGFETSYADAQKILNDYINTEYSPQIKEYQTGVIEKDIQDLINKQTQSSIDYLNNPQVMGSIMAGYNQKGLLDAGAFSEGVANTLAGGANQQQIQALQGTVLPSVMSMNPINAQTQSYSSEPYTMFNMQKLLAQQLANSSKPSDLEKWAPIISGGLQGAGSAYGNSGGTFLCTKLMEMNIVTKDELIAVHNKLKRQIKKNPVYYRAYQIIAPMFIKIATKYGFDWKLLRKYLVDDVLNSKTSKEAFERYKFACINLFSITGLLEA